MRPVALEDLCGEYQLDRSTRIEAFAACRAYDVAMQKATAPALDLAGVASVMGDPARARMLTALMGGMALTATELSTEADVAASTASAHLAKLCQAGLLSLTVQGRHRYFRIADPAIAEAIEQLTGIAATAPRHRTGPADPALRRARVCYDHLAGERGVWLFDALRRAGILTGPDATDVSAEGERFFAAHSIDVIQLSRGQRPLCRTCIDWSERRRHLAGALGAALLERILALRWARRRPGSRALEFTPAGERTLERLFDGVPAASRLARA